MRTRVAHVEGSPVVVVSGASSGIGEDAAGFLSELGYTVMAGVRRTSDGDALRATASAPERLRPVLLDVTSDEQVAAAATTVEVLVGTGRRFAGVFSNAGIAHLEGDTSCEGTPMHVLEQLTAVNFLGATRLVRALLPRARATRAAVVLNTALMARTVLPFNAGYAATKCALEGWGDSLRREVARWGVRVVMVEASAISTGIAGAHGGPVSGDNPYPEQRRFLQRAVARMDARHDDPHCAPRRVSELVAHALQAERPRARYHVGGGARAIHALGSLPDAVQDRVLTRLVSSRRA